MYLGEAIAKGGINAKLYRKAYGELSICYAGHQFVAYGELPICYAGHRFVALENAIADYWEIVPEHFTLEDAIKEARKRGSAIMLRRAGEREVSLSAFAIASDEWEVC